MSLEIKEQKDIYYDLMNSVKRWVSIESLIKELSEPVIESEYLYNDDKKQAVISFKKRLIKMLKRSYEEGSVQE